MKFQALALIALGFWVSTEVYILSNGYLGSDERGKLPRTISTAISAVAGLMFIIVTWNSFIDPGGGITEREIQLRNDSQLSKRTETSLLIEMMGHASVAWRIAATGGAHRLDYM